MKRWIKIVGLAFLAAVAVACVVRWIMWRNESILISWDSQIPNEERTIIKNFLHTEKRVRHFLDSRDVIDDMITFVDWRDGAEIKIHKQKGVLYSAVIEAHQHRMASTVYHMTLVVRDGDVYIKDVLIGM